MSADPGFSTAESREIFGPARRLGAMLEVESALARGAAAAGLIDESAARAIEAACRDGEFDPEAIFAAGWETGSPVLPLIAALRDAVGEAHAEAVHVGATTQDIVDTAQVLQMREGLTRLERDLSTIGGVLADLADTHRATPRLARTLLQPAGATTFGFTAARWLDGLSRDLRRVRHDRGAAALQLGGAVGDQAVWGEHAETLESEMAQRLGMTVPAVPWHTARDRIGSVAATLGIVSQTVVKIAGDLVLLARAEMGEVSMRGGASSAMPDKRNPIDAVRAIAASRYASGQAALLLAPVGHELERGTGSWQLEWAAVPALFHGTLASTEALRRALGTLDVHVDRMAEHLDRLPPGRTESGPRTGRLIDRVLEAWRALET